FPKEMKTVGFYPMHLFPNYSYTQKVRSNHLKPKLTAEEYEYWHKLYFLTRTDLPRAVVKALGRSRLVRRFPRLLDRLLPDQLPFFYLDNGALDLETATLKLTDATGRVSGEEELKVPAWLRQPVTPPPGERRAEAGSPPSRGAVLPGAGEVRRHLGHPPPAPAALPHQGRP